MNSNEVIFYKLQRLTENLENLLSFKNEIVLASTKDQKILIRAIDSKSVLIGQYSIFVDAFEPDPEIILSLDLHNKTAEISSYYDAVTHYESSENSKNKHKLNQRVIKWLTTLANRGYGGGF